MISVSTLPTPLAAWARLDCTVNAGQHIVLLVDDNDDDIFLFKLALTEAGIADPVHTAADGKEAIEYLSGKGRFRDRKQYPLPTVMFLDLRMSRTDGFEVLRWIGNESNLEDLRTVVLSTSAEMK